MLQATLALERRKRRSMEGPGWQWVSPLLGRIPGGWRREEPGLRAVNNWGCCAVALKVKVGSLKASVELLAPLSSSSLLTAT